MSDFKVEKDGKGVGGVTISFTDAESASGEAQTGSDGTTWLQPEPGEIITLFITGKEIDDEKRDYVVLEGTNELIY